MRQKVVYENRSRLRQVCGNMLYVSHNESLCVHLLVLSVSGDFYCHLPILYLSSHTHTLAGSWRDPLPKRPPKQTPISHTPTQPEMLEILSRGDNMFASQSRTCSPVVVCPTQTDILHRTGLVLIKMTLFIFYFHFHIYFPHVFF